MIVGVSVGEVRPGYELWRPNREKAESVTTKVVTVFLLAATSIIALIIGIAGFGLMSGGTGMAVVTLIYGLLYAFFAYLVARWNRGILPVAAGLAIILAIFAVVAAPAWFARDKVGLDSPALPEELLGLLTLLVVPVQLALIAIAMIGFNQNWHVEEERPIGGGGYDDAPPDADEQRPAAAPA
jgi:hypothetical protein